MKITQADTPTIRMDCHPSRLIGGLHTQWFGLMRYTLIIFYKLLYHRQNANEHSMLQWHELTHLRAKSSLPDVPWETRKASNDFTNFSMFAIVYLNKMIQINVVVILLSHTCNTVIPIRIQLQRRSYLVYACWCTDKVIGGICDFVSLDVSVH